MSSPTIVTCLLGIYFFLAGCLQIAMHVGTAPTDPFPPFLHGLVAASWPLGVAGVLFILLDIRSQQALNAQRTRLPQPGAHHADYAEEEEESIPEAPMQPKRRYSPPKQPQPAVSYFNVEAEPATTTASAPAPAPTTQAPPPSAPAPTIFATPPPYQQQAAAPLNATVPLSGAKRGGVPASAAAGAPTAPQPPPLYSPAGATVPLDKLTATKPTPQPQQEPQQAPRQDDPKQQDGLSFFKV